MIEKIRSATIAIFCLLLFWLLLGFICYSLESLVTMATIAGYVSWKSLFEISKIVATTMSFILVPLSLCASLMFISQEG